MGRVLRFLAFMAAALAGTAALAAPEEIKVFTDELAAYGEHTLETHANKASRAGPRASSRLVPLQIMPEYSYGLWRNWEFSLQVPAAVSQSSARLQGYRAELQYIAPHNADSGFYWGANFELARISRPGEAAFWNVEVIPILGYRSERWQLVANPGFERAVSGASQAVRFQPAAKAAYRLSGQNYLGLECYIEAGPAGHPLPRAEQSRVLFLAWDGKIGKSDLNVGLGRGFTEASDRWVVKMIYEFSF